jgi:hypothetical protein
MKNFSPAVALPFLLLAACDGGNGPATTNVTSVKVANPYVEQLHALTEMNRGLALRRAIQDAGNRCKKVDASGFQQDYKNLSMWTARCSDSGEWALFIAPNADVQVRACDTASRLGLPECRVATEQPAAQ